MAKAFTKLTRAAMRKLAPGGDITEHGINFERFANGDGVYTVNVMVEGQRIHRVIGKDSDGTTRTHAEEFIEKVRRDARDNRLSLPTGRKIALGFREAAGKYLHKLEEEGGKNLVAKRQHLTLHLVPFFADSPLARMSSFDVERYKKHRLQEDSLRGGVRRVKGTAAPHPVPCKNARKTAPGTVNREIATLSHLLNKATEWGWIERRPAKMRRLKEGGRKVYLTVEQAGRLLQAAKRDLHPQIYAFVLIGLETSMRLMEILSIRREHVELQRRIIYIPKAKSGDREQPITASLAAYLEEHLAALPDGCDWLFPSPGSKRGHTINIVPAYKRVVAAAGLNPDIVVRHTLRHTAISHLVQAGVDIPTVARVSGHKTLSMVARYAHQDGEHIQAAMDKLEKRYRNVA